MNDLKTTGASAKKEDGKEGRVAKTWTKPTVSEISRFSILSLAPTVSTTEGATFRAKSA